MMMNKRTGHRLRFDFTLLYLTSTSGTSEYAIELKRAAMAGELVYEEDLPPHAVLQ